MSEGHTALLIEDELDTAQEFGDLITSLGHTYKHSVSQEGAKALVAQHDFCYALVDLQIKTTDTAAAAKVEVGQNLVKYLRGLFPRRDAHDQHHLPILVMSGHAKDTPSVVKSLQDGGDDFVVKPIHKNKEPLTQVICEALRKSGRTDHCDCAAATLEAVGGVRGRTDEVPTIARIEISGHQVSRRLEVKLGGATVHLRNASFLTLLRLVAGRLNGDSWVHKHELGARDDQGWKGMTRFKDDLREGLPPNFDPTVNDNNGGYRLNPGLGLGRIDTDALKRIDDARISELAREICRLQKVAGRPSLRASAETSLRAAQP